MSAHEQTDLFGGSIPLEELELTGHSRAIAQLERELGQRVTADEAGALVHERRGRHPRDQRCQWCSEDGTQALIQLNTHRHRIQERHAAATRPGWTCAECGRDNPGDATTFCRGCAAIRGEDPEPHVPARDGGLQPRAHTPYDPATADIPF
ncbi:MAG TPA: hypothetical protein VM204_06935 [Gaiellaceae bacterium]|nr:hypothetical protein [Gaiellaceae bacterium]